MEITEELNRNREKVRPQGTINHCERTSSSIPPHPPSPLCPKIESASSRVRQVADLTGHARRLVHSMTKREKQQKIMLGCVALFLVATAGTIIWLVVEGSKK